MPERKDDLLKPKIEAQLVPGGHVTGIVKKEPNDPGIDATLPYSRPVYIDPETGELTVSGARI